MKSIEAVVGRFVYKTWRVLLLKSSINVGAARECRYSKASFQGGISVIKTRFMRESERKCALLVGYR